MQVRTNMISNHGSRLRVDSHMLCFKIRLDKGGQLIFSFFLTFKHHAKSVCLRHQLRSSVDSSVLIAQHQDCCFGWFRKILLQLFNLFHCLRFFYNYHTPGSRHDGIPLCQFYHPCHIYVGAIHHILVEELLIRLQHIIGNVVGYLINEIRFIAHQDIDGLIDAAFQLSHHRIVCQCHFFFCHINLLY